jgi:hypothetical protein
MTRALSWPAACLLAMLCLPAAAVQETFTDAGPLDCSAIQTCQQATSDGLFQLNFKPAFPWSAASPLGFEVREKAVVLRPASGGLLDLGSMSVSLIGSTAYNGSNFIGALRLDVQDASGAWSTASQWSSWVGSPTGIYVVFNGHNAQSPLVQGVQAIRLTGVNGTTAFRIGMMNLNAR